MRRRVLYSKNGSDEGIVDGSKAKTCDVVFANKNTENLIIVSDWSLSDFPSSEWEPIGVVVIPGGHGVIKDGTGTKNQCVVMSLVEMSHTKPEIGSTSSTQIYWGGYGTNITGKSDGLGRFDSVSNGLQNYTVVCHVGNKGQVNETILGTVEHDAYFPSDNFTTVKNPYDSETSYYYNDGNYYIPSPYKNDGSYNPIYSQTEWPSSSNNALSDFKGIINTKILTDLATGQSNWRTASTITNNTGSTYYPSACCCARFKTTGTKAFVDCSTDELRNGTGFWYLPAMGELGYIMPRVKQINQTINALKSDYRVGMSIWLDSGNYYWSSTEYDAYDACDVYTYWGNFGDGLKNYTDHYVRAFMRL